MTTITRGPHRPLLEITSTEKQFLDQLYRFDGGWTFVEAEQNLGADRVKEMVRLNMIGAAPTELGPLLVLLSHGRIAAYGVAGKSVSLAQQINLAYFRLSLKALGWQLPEPGEPTRKLEEFDAMGSFREVRTQYGLALVTAKLTGNGYSVKHIRRFTERLKSTALYENFYVIVLTPNGRKGQSHAVSQEAFLKVLKVRPEFPTGTLGPVLFAPPQAQPTPAGPHLAGESWKTDPQFLHLPSMVVRTLRKNRDDRVEQAMLSIECDGVMSAAQLKSYYALNPDDLPALHRKQALLRTTPSQRTSETQVEFLTLSRRLSTLDDYKLAHRCGTGRMRHQIDIPPDPAGWKAEHRGMLRLEEPDAIYFEKDGIERAVEFDNGTYSRRTIDTKLSTFRDRGFLETIWGVSNPTRLRNLTQEIGNQLHREILLAEWWK